MTGVETRIGGGWRLLAAAACCGLVLAGCESSRFASRSPSVRTRADSPAEPTVSSVPAGTVTAEALPPPTGLYPPAGSPPPAISPEPAPRPADPPSGPVAATRGAAIGTWTAREAAGTSCRVNLSSTPSLDLYRASAVGCQNRELARVTSWDFRDGEVYLYQPGGAVAARLRPAGGDLSGVLSKSGAPLSMTRA